MTEIKIMSLSKKIILTGPTGLIGKEAIKLLLDCGFEVFALTIDKLNPDYGIKWINCNIFDEYSVKNVFAEIKPDYLLHFAWITTGDYLTSDINYKFIDASLNMLNEFKINGGTRAVFAGTCFDYIFKDEPLKETDELNPLTVYAKCKNELREKAQKYCLENNVSFGWGRIFYVYGHGENEKRLVPHVINSLKNDKEVVITSGEAIRDYMYSKNIAGAFVKFLDCDIQGCVNICSSKRIKIKDMVNIIGKLLNKEYLIKYKDNMDNQPKIILGNNDRLIKKVGFINSDDFYSNIVEIIDLI
jgi:nucleoside-diphosphate-sugar epimerase